MVGNRLFFIIGIVLLAFGLLLAVSSWRALGYGASGSDPDDALLYEKNCKLCHGIDGKGNPKMAKTFGEAKLDLTDEETVKKSDADLLEIVSEGAGKMKGFKEKLAKPEIKVVVVHVRTLQAKKSGASGK